MFQQIIVKERESAEDEQIIIPIYIPDLDKILAFANELAKANVEYEGPSKAGNANFSPIN